MLKFNRLVWALVICTCVTVSFGAAVKIRAFETFAPESIEADGMAILNYASGNNRTIIQIIISDFTPGETYDLRIVSPGGLTLDFADALMTDENGHGTLHTLVPGDKSTWDVELYVDEDGSNSLEPDERRSYGDNPGS